ncbi:hypothetical protein CHUAL_008285 [Chamberlinius hualienensis]
MLWYVVLLVFLTLCVLHLIVKRSKTLRNKVFAVFYELFTKERTAALIPYKKELFQELHGGDDDKSQLRRPLRILELGAGPGTNFEFYPENSRIIVVEPNHHFTQIRRNNMLKWPTLREERTIIGGGEDMRAIESNTVDAVVDSMVLCSVTNMDQVFREIHRVLKPGGKYYFIEHGEVKRAWWQHLLHYILNPASNSAHHHNHHNHHKKEFDKVIKHCGLFTDISMTVRPLKAKVFLKTVSDNITFGSAKKSLVLVRDLGIEIR